MIGISNPDEPRTWFGCGIPSKGTVDHEDVETLRLPRHHGSHGFGLKKLGIQWLKMGRCTTE